MVRHFRHPLSFCAVVNPLCPPTTLSHECASAQKGIARARIDRDDGRDDDREREDGPTTSGKLMEAGVRVHARAYIPGREVAACVARELGEDSF